MTPHDNSQRPRRPLSRLRDTLTIRKLTSQQSDWGVPGPAAGWVEAHGETDQQLDGAPAPRDARTRLDNPRYPGGESPRPWAALAGHLRRDPVLAGTVLGGAVLLGLAVGGGMALRSPSQGVADASSVSGSLSGATAPQDAALTGAGNSAAGAAQPAASAKSAAASLLTVPAGWQLKFDPSFSSSSLSSAWATCYDWAQSGAGCTNNPHLEREWYLPSQVAESGTLNLTATQEPTQGLSSTGAAVTYGCRSGMVTSKPGFNFTYGLIQITAKVPYGPGLWPALWLAASDDQWPPELDIMEHWYSQRKYNIYDHVVGAHYLGGQVPTPANLSTGFHTYSLLWTKDRVTWYLDGVQEFTTTEKVPQQPMYFIANVADRNPDGDTTAPLVSGACNGTMQISSVKVYQP